MTDLCDLDGTPVCALEDECLGKRRALLWCREKERHSPSVAGLYHAWTVLVCFHRLHVVNYGYLERWSFLLASRPIEAVFCTSVELA